MADHNRWIKFYPRDWFADTRTLTTEEQGAYFILCMEAVLRDGKLPSDPDALQVLALVRDAGRWKRIWGKIGHYFQLTDAGAAIVQRRVLKELDLAKERVESARRGGKASAESRSRRVTPEFNGTSTVVELPCEQSSNHEHDPLLNDQDHKAEAEQEADQEHRPQTGAQTRSNGSAKSVPLSPVSPELRRWGAEEWFEAFRMAWVTYLGAGSYGGQPADYRAVGDMREVLRKVSLDDALAAQRRSSSIFAEFFGDRGDEIATARYPWGWFVTRFNGLRLPKATAQAKRGHSRAEHNVEALADWEPPKASQV